MVKSDRQNAIVERLDELESLWNEFAENPDARLLRWLTDADGAKMVDLMVDLQSEEAGELPDLFVKFIQPFDDHTQYGFGLRQSLIDQYNDIRESIAEDDIANEWECPAPVRGEPDLITFARACMSFREYYDGMMLHFVAFLYPPQISDAENWQRWLLSLARSGLPANVRIMVIDDVGAPLLTQMCDIEKKLIQTIEPELDMPGAYEELSRG
ncbi:MAG: hypothetical protein GF341_03170 [candidate division Zixibacteria bacterium]|nr:hypothetical protein [candidate division Zixibacteria bacterium]